MHSQEENNNNNKLVQTEQAACISWPCNHAAACGACCGGGGGGGGGGVRIRPPISCNLGSHMWSINFNINCSFEFDGWALEANSMAASNQASGE